MLGFHLTALGPNESISYHRCIAAPVSMRFEAVSFWFRTIICDSFASRFRMPNMRYGYRAFSPFGFIWLMIDVSGILHRLSTQRKMP